MSNISSAFQLAFLCLLSASTIGEAAVNLALHKKVTYCNKKNLSEILVDGNVNPDAAERIDETCTPNAFISIKLDGTFRIDYVIVHEGTYKSPYRGQLDYFWVNVRAQMSGRSVIYQCATFPMKSEGAAQNKPMRVNCKSVQNATEVELTSEHQFGFSIAEIEVYSLASEGIEQFVWIPRGCVRSFDSRRKMPLTDWRKCQTFCAENQFRFLAILENQTCHCGFTYDKKNEVELWFCNLKCKNSDFRCGGVGTYSMYIVSIDLPHYVGCTPYSETVASLAGPDMTISKCMHHCEMYWMASVNGNKCTCKGQAVIISSHSKFCNISCPGDQKWNCGGMNYDSLYGTCSRNSDHPTPCSALFRCSGTWNEFGVCNSGCEDGYRGEHCLEKVIPERMACDIYPCENYTNSLCKLISVTSYICYCLPGFAKNLDSDEYCLDVDECFDEPCDKSSSHCINLIGSYICMCRPNFERDPNNHCIAPQNSNIRMKLFRAFVVFMATLTVLVTSFNFYQNNKGRSSKSKSTKSPSRI